MSHIRIVSRAVIHAPAAAAWAVLSDYANDPLWRAGVSRMEQTPPGRIREGARAVEQLRVLGRELRNDVVVEDVEEGAWFAWRVIGGVDAHGTRRILPFDAHSCELVTEKHLALSGTDRLLTPLVAWTIRRTEAADARRAAGLVESRI
ncbi:SRPBCC family protein [Protaetiibacter larvae]|uniref:SRPBCC family protein n=1 Tax=Protaetiibacter larvae TaxID=2592654 RepID=A0A5C1Y9N8_9MICO|nr:SRPBCC family protein [Protaetiibacter larvae]QEO09869.1 hypothetical protein FLP23_07535 [Protaetiibacter larvae]